MAGLIIAIKRDHVMTEDRNQRHAEHNMDRLDIELLNGALTQEAYDEEVRLLEQWVRDQYKTLK